MKHYVRLLAPQLRQRRINTGWPALQQVLPDQGSDTMRKPSSVMALLISILLVGVPACTSGEGGEERRTLRVLGYGGAYNEVLEENVKSFEEEMNVDVVIEASEGATALELARNGDADVVFSDPIYSFLGEQEGIYAPIEYESFENLSNIYPIARMSDATVIHDMGAYGLAYNPDQVADPPTSWNDLWDDRFDGKVSIRGFRPDTIELMVWAAKQNGGDERNIDPGFEKMEELAPRVQTFFGEHTELLNLFQTDAVDVAMWTGGRVGWAQDQGADVEWVAPAEGPFALVSTMNIVNGTGNEDLAQAYINHELSVESGTNMADKLGYFPTNSTIVLPPDVQARVDFTPETIEDVQMADWAYIVTVIDDWRHRWETEVIN